MTGGKGGVRAGAMQLFYRHADSFLQVSFFLAEVKWHDRTVQDALFRASSSLRSRDTPPYPMTVMGWTHRSDRYHVTVTRWSGAAYPDVG
jgi:hypothetical protein